MHSNKESTHFKNYKRFFKWYIDNISWVLPNNTASTLILSGFLSGAVLVETIFAWPGMGDAAIRAVNNNDFPLLQGFVFFFTILFVGTTFITDLLYAYIDPRIRYD